jgi:hypothetical protein
MMRAKLPGIVGNAPVYCAAALLAATLLQATTLSSPVSVQTVARQTRERRTAPPSSRHPSQLSSASPSTQASRANGGVPSRNSQTRSSDSQTHSPNSQTQRSSDRAQTSSEAGAPADISITAHVTADSLRFEKVPNPRVEFTGRPRRETVWEAERENLPQQVQPGVTYRNVGITLRITSVFADIDRIVAEALGEVPASDETQPTPAPPTPAPPTPTTPVQPAADNPRAVSTPATGATPRPARRGGRN